MAPRKDVRPFHTSEHGITGIETAIILIAFVVVAAVFAFAILATGQFAADRSKETIFAGLAKTRSTMSLSGGLIATSDGTEVTGFRFNVALSAGGAPVSWDPDAGTQKTTISYIDDSVQISGLTYTPTPLTGDADLLLEAGELFEIAVTGLGVDADINAGDMFTLQIQPASGAVMAVQRTMPGSIGDPIIDLN